MLKSFTVGNFRIFSAENPVTIDFSNIGKYDYNTDCIKDGIAKTAIMYGKNASGKSSLAYAIFDIVSNLTDKFVDPHSYSNYLNAWHPELFAQFEYNFLFNGKNVKYIYKKRDRATFVAESLWINGNQVISYDRTASDTDFIVELKGTENLQKDLKQLRISALKWVKNNSALVDNDENKVFYDLFDFVNKMLLFWSLEDRSFAGYSDGAGVDIVEEIIKTGHFADLKDFFTEAGFEEELVHSNRSGKERLYFKYDENLVSFNDARSTGMNSLLLVYYWLKDVQNKEKAPSFICIDEFDAFYHFALSRFVVRKLKKCQSQVLLTTHNTALFSNDLLRPDCYFICSKDKIVNASNATPKELRQGHNLEKLYRGGTFGL